jgi:hypothetical protein
MLGKGQCKICDKKIMTWDFPYHPGYQPSTHISTPACEISAVLDWKEDIYFIAAEKIACVAGSDNWVFNQSNTPTRDVVNYRKIVNLYFINI